MPQLLLPILILFCMNTAAQTHQPVSVKINWERAAILPPAKGQAKSLGFAGPINGVSNNVFITGGGANFPDGLPWNGGAKRYSEEVYVLQKKGDELVWIEEPQLLPEPIAYCGTTSTEKGIVYVGGENDKGISKKAFLLNWDSVENKVVFKTLPDLPFPLTNVAVSHIGNMVYAAGGDEKDNSSKSFLSLGLEDENAQWTALPGLPFALANAALMARGKNLYLVGGRTKNPSGLSELHGTTYVFDTENKTWKKLANICVGRNPANLSAAAGIALGDHYLLMIGGDDGKVFHRIETYLSNISKAKSETEKEKLTREKNELLTGHQGFSRKLLLYNIPSDCWTTMGEYPFPAQVTTTAVNWNGKIIVSNGEIRPGVRTPDIIEGKRVK